MKRTAIKNGKIVLNGKVQEGDLLIADGKIVEIVKDCPENGDHDIYDAEGHYLLPGFIDVHTHGAVEVDMNHADVEGLQKVADFFAHHGTSSFLASVLTDTEENTLRIIAEVVEFQEKRRTGANLLGIHLEGPFLSKAYKGAMPEALLRWPDLSLLEKYQAAAKGAIKYLTISPELPDALDVIRGAEDLGIVVSMGHSGADYETSMEAIRCGVNSCTHTFNAMKLSHQHFPAIMGAALESDVYCEAICDGRHLHPGIVRLLLKTKGWDKVVAVSDSIMATGLADGTYQLGAHEIIVKDGDAKLVDGITRAGSTLTMIDAMKNIGEYTGKGIPELSPLLSGNPANLLGVYDQIGSLHPGKDADILVMNSEFEIIEMFIKGIRQQFS